MQSKIKDFINFCYNDTDSIDFQLFLITVKCLIPYEENIGCFFDVDRYRKEIKLFAYYKNSDDEIIDYWIKHKRPSNNKDKLLECKIIPIILSNTKWELLIDEVLRAVTFYTLNKNTILSAILISSAIYEFVENSDIENIEIVTKERLINFSIKDTFAKYQISTEKNYIIDFEKERIKLFTKPMLFDDNSISKYKSLNYIFNSKTSENKNTTNNSNRDNNDNSSSNNNTDIIDSFSSYLYKLRKGTINPEKLKISDKIPDLKECLKQPLFNHPLLGRCKVVKRSVNEVIIQNKSGLMRIKI